MNCIYRDVPLEIKSTDGENRSVFVASTASEDLAGDTIDPKGWVLDSKKKLPFLWQHKSTEPPIGRLENTWVEGKRLISEILWDMNSDRAKELYRQVKEGFISTCSVGFWPLEYKERRDDKQRFLGFEFTKQRLLELSLVNIPANPDAVVLQRSHELAAFLKDRVPVLAPKSPSNLAMARVALAKHRGRALERFAP